MLFWFVFGSPQEITITQLGKIKKIKKITPYEKEVIKSLVQLHNKHYNLLDSLERHYKVSKEIIMTLKIVESGDWTNDNNKGIECLRGANGEYGILQLMPYEVDLHDLNLLCNDSINLIYGYKAIADIIHKKKCKSWECVISYYNCGSYTPKCLNNKTTRKYIKLVKERYAYIGHNYYLLYYRLNDSL